MASASPPDTFIHLCALLVELAAEAPTPAAPSVVQARIDVYRYLVDEGWQPPERVRSLLHLNDLVLALDVEQWLDAVEEARESDPPHEIDLRNPPVDDHASRLVTEAEQDLVLVTRPIDATRRLVALVQELGGDLALADDAADVTAHAQSGDVLPLDLSFGEGPPVLVRAKALSLARLRLERHLPALVEVARRALAAASR